MLNNWIQIARESLEKSTGLIPTELNELDWKVKLSENHKRINEHLSAFANYPGGGFLVFGIDGSGNYVGLTDHPEKILSRLNNLAAQGVEPPVSLAHQVIEANKAKLLVVHILETSGGPVHIHGRSIEDSWIRSGGTSKKMSKEDIRQYFLRQDRMTFEAGNASNTLSGEEILNLLNFQEYFRHQNLPIPEKSEDILKRFVGDKILSEKPGGFQISVFGGLLLANDLGTIPNLARKALRIIQYKGDTKTETIREIVETKGYAVGFQEFLKDIFALLPTNEAIEAAIRKQLKLYPEIAVREILANALIHQDLAQGGSGPMVEIFSSRIVITNPGKPLIDTRRFLDSSPQSRNEKIADLMRRFNWCEERGSGIDKVLFETELYQLPSPDFDSGDDFTRVTLFAPKSLRDMSRDEKVRACYLHCCLRYVNQEKMTNSSLRKRLQIKDSNYPIASSIINQTMGEGLIKHRQGSRSTRDAYYVPYWVS